MRVFLKFLTVFTVLAAVSCEVFFEENFTDDKWKDEWVYSEKSGKEFGKFVRTAGKFFNDEGPDNENLGSLIGWKHNIYYFDCDSFQSPL